MGFSVCLCNNTLFRFQTLLRILQNFSYFLIICRLFQSFILQIICTSSSYSYLLCRIDAYFFSSSLFLLLLLLMFFHISKKVLLKPGYVEKHKLKAFCLFLHLNSTNLVDLIHLVATQIIRCYMFACLVAIVVLCVKDMF